MPSNKFLAYLVMIVNAILSILVLFGAMPFSWPFAILSNLVSICFLLSLFSGNFYKRG